MVNNSDFSEIPPNENNEKTVILSSPFPRYHNSENILTNQVQTQSSISIHPMMKNQIIVLKSSRLFQQFIHRLRRRF
jgi:hypothetical protein